MRCPPPHPLPPQLPPPPRSSSSSSSSSRGLGAACLLLLLSLRGQDDRHSPRLREWPCLPRRRWLRRHFPEVSPASPPPRTRPSAPSLPSPLLTRPLPQRKQQQRRRQHQNQLSTARPQRRLWTRQRQQRRMRRGVGPLHPPARRASRGRCEESDRRRSCGGCRWRTCSLLQAAFLRVAAAAVTPVCMTESPTTPTRRTRSTPLWLKSSRAVRAGSVCSCALPPLSVASLGRRGCERTRTLSRQARI